MTLIEMIKNGLIANEHIEKRIDSIVDGALMFGDRGPHNPQTLEFTVCLFGTMEFTADYVPEENDADKCMDPRTDSTTFAICHTFIYRPAYSINEVIGKAHKDQIYSMIADELGRNLSYYAQNTWMVNNKFWNINNVTVKTESKHNIYFRDIKGWGEDMAGIYYYDENAGYSWIKVPISPNYKTGVTVLAK